MSLRITTLIENNEDDNEVLYKEHGLSLYIEIDEMKILFDTGQSGNFIKNAEKLKVDFKNLSYVVLSHGHYDHTGGLRKLIDVGSPIKLIIGEQFFNKKYKILEDGTYKYNGNSFDEAYISKNNIPIKYINKDVFYLNKNTMIFSNFKSSNAYEILNKKFIIEKDGNYLSDSFLEEIVLAVNLEKGLMAILLGCSHVGVVNILETIIQRTGMPIYGILGGTHLVDADELRLKETINYLKEKDIKLIGVSHCTGENNIDRLKAEFGDRFIFNNTGNKIEIV